MLLQAFVVSVSAMLLYSTLIGGLLNSYAQPSFKNSDLKADLIVEEGLSSPTSMAYIDGNNILVLEKNSGEVRLVSNGVLQEEPVLKLDVDATTLTCCRGLLGVASLGKDVFLYLSEASKDDQPVRNRLYKYQWNEQEHTLVNPQLILDLPATPGPNHPGGKIAIGEDHYLYTVIGDLNNEGQLQNIQDGPEPNDSSVILKISPKDGSPAKDNPFLNTEQGEGQNQMKKYYAYGIRNSFGLVIDPITGFLWEAENGDRDYDEINIVRPGFNSGWSKLMGPISESDVTEEDLVRFPNSHYSDPVFSWSPSLGITDIEFLDSSKLGPRYANNIFVGDITNGNLYFFEVNQSRTGLVFDNPDIQTDLVADDEKQLDGIILATGFGGITDIETGPDGLLYILTFDQESDGEGKIYRILSSDSTVDNSNIITDTNIQINSKQKPYYMKIDKTSKILSSGTMNTFL